MIYSAKIVQMSEKASSLLECFSECSLSYEKIVQASGMTKQNTQFLFFIPERRLSYLKMQASGMTKQNTQFLFFHSRA